MLQTKASLEFDLEKSFNLAGNPPPSLELVRTYALDPQNPHEIDDGVYAEAVGKRIRVTITLADSTRILENPQASEYANTRLRSVYEPFHIPMVPQEELIDELNLKEGSLTPAIAIRFDIKKNNTIDDIEVKRVIADTTAISYDQFDKKIYNEGLGEFKTIIRAMNRMLESRNHRPLDYRRYLHWHFKNPGKEDHEFGRIVVKTFMNETGKQAALHMNGTDTAWIYRNHQLGAVPGFKPTDRRIPDDIIKMAATSGLGSYSTNSVGHFSLGQDHHSHLTSGLRRIGDAYNLAQLIDVAENRPTRYDHTDLARVALAMTKQGVIDLMERNNFATTALSNVA